MLLYLQLRSVCVTLPAATSCCKCVLLQIPSITVSHCFPQTFKCIQYAVVDLAKKVYSAKPKQVTLHGLPLAWNLVRSLSTTGSTAVLREAVADYIKNLYGLMGPGLFEYCSSAPDSNPQLVAMVRELSGA